MKIHVLGLLFVLASAAFAQTPDQAQAADLGPTILSRAELEVPTEAATGRGGNYFNFFANADFIYGNQGFTSSLANSNSALAGYDAGLGVNLLEYYRSGVLTLNYTGGYRGYSGLNNDPTNNIIQNLSLAFNKQLNRHVTFTFKENAGWNPGGWIPQPLTTPQSQLSLNLIADRTTTSVTSLALTFQQTRRLSWQVGGDFSEMRYVPSSSNIGSFGGDASLGVNYRLNRKTTLGGTATYQYFSFLQSHGDSVSNSANLNLSYLFGPRMQLGVSGGVFRSTYDALSAQVFGSTLLITSGRQATYSPSVSARFSITRRHASFFLNGGEGVSAGNGIFLASKMIYAGGSLSYAATRRWSFSLGGGYQRLESIAGGPGGPQEFVNGSANYKLASHIGVRATGTYTAIEAVTVFPQRSFYNLMLGVFFTSADRPLASIF